MQDQSFEKCYEYMNRVRETNGGGRRVDDIPASKCKLRTSPNLEGKVSLNRKIEHSNPKERHEKNCLEDEDAKEIIDQEMDRSSSLEMREDNHAQKKVAHINDTEVNGQDEAGDLGLIENLKMQLQKALGEVKEIQQDKARVMALEKKAKSELNEVRKQLDRLTGSKGQRRGKYRKSTRSKVTGPVNEGLKGKLIDGQINQNQERGYKGSRSHSSKIGRNAVKPIFKEDNQCGYCFNNHGEGKCQAATRRCYKCRQIGHFVRCCQSKGKGDEAKRDHVKEIHAQRINGKNDVWIPAVHCGNPSFAENIKARSGRDVRRNGGGENRVHIANLDERIDERNLENLFGRYGLVKEVWLAKSTPCFAFVVYHSKEDAESAVGESNGIEFYGKRIRVSVARPRTKGMVHRRFDSSMKCYQCGNKGHFYRSCNSGKNVPQQRITNCGLSSSSGKTIKAPSILRCENVNSLAANDMGAKTSEDKEGDGDCESMENGGIIRGGDVTKMEKEKLDI